MLFSALSSWLFPHKGCVFLSLPSISARADVRALCSGSASLTRCPRLAVLSNRARSAQSRSSSSIRISCSSLASKARAVARSASVTRMLRSRVIRIARSVLDNLVSIYRKPLSFGRRVRSASFNRYLGRRGLPSQVSSRLCPVRGW
jgi:hypothetical protein